MSVPFAQFDPRGTRDQPTHLIARTELKFQQYFRHQVSACDLLCSGIEELTLLRALHLNHNRIVILEPIRSLRALKIF